MNGLEALEHIKNIDKVEVHYYTTDGMIKRSEVIEAIKRELKVNQILKEKKVDLGLLDRFLCFNSIEDILDQYNEITKSDLTLEEMQTIVEWLKGE